VSATSYPPIKGKLTARSLVIREATRNPSLQLEAVRILDVVNFRVCSGLRPAQCCKPQSHLHHLSRTYLSNDAAVMFLASGSQIRCLREFVAGLSVDVCCATQFVSRGEPQGCVIGYKSETLAVRPVYKKGGQERRGRQSSQQTGHRSKVFSLQVA